MDIKIVFSTFGIASLLLVVFAYAQTLSQPSITAPSSGSSFTQGATFTLSADVSCSGAQNTVCNNMELTVTLPSGLSTSTATQSCGNVNRGDSCSKSWTINADTVGTYSITVTGSSTNAGTKTSNSISVSVTTAPAPAPASAPPPPPAPTTISIEMISPTVNQTFVRGEKINVKAKLTAGGSALSDADANVEMLSQTFRLHDDGLHNDEKTNDGIYAGDIEVKSWYEGSYKITISASESRYTGASDSREIIVNPLLNVTAVLDKTEHFKGEKLSITGIVKDSSNRSVQGGNLNFVMTSGLFKVARTSEVGVTGNFLFDYFIGFGDPEGSWSINVSVVDSNINHGFTVLSLPVKTPPAGTFYYVKFLSPAEGLSYQMGETIKISVEVTEANKSVTNATASLKTPKGAILVLNETSPGVYTSAYELGWDEPIGDANLIAEGIKEVEGKLKAGGNFIPIAVKPVELKLDLVSPDKSDFVVGEPLVIAAKAFYPDGTSVSGANIFVESPKGEKIFLEEEEEGFYKADYKIKTGEEGRWQMQLKAVDAYENSASFKKAIIISRITIFYLLLQYWYLAVIGISPFAYLGYRLTKSASAKSRLEDMKGELNRVVQMKKEAQTKYYRKGSIDKATYDSLMREYEDKEQDLRTKIAKAKKR